MPKFCSVTAENALQPVSKEARNEFKSISRLVSDNNLHAVELRQHVRGKIDCKWTLNDSRDEELAEESLQR